VWERFWEAKMAQLIAEGTLLPITLGIGCEAKVFLEKLLLRIGNWDRA
jgi:hypothetical protein